MTALIDTHQHLIYPEIAGYGWTDGIPPMAGNTYSLETYQDLTKTADIQGSLFMETGVDDADYRDETRYVAQLVKAPESGILGIIASCRPENDSGFAAWLDECENLNVLGYRRVLHTEPDALSTSETFRRNVRAIGARNKSFDMCFLASQLGVAYDLAAACDNTRLILNHCGVPDISGAGLDPWREDMRKLAELPHVTCKLSGLLAYCPPGQANLSTIRPYVDHVLQVFGPDRMVWGSDWPVVELANGLPDWISVTNHILGELSSSEASAIARGNATRVYGLGITD